MISFRTLRPTKDFMRRSSVRRLAPTDVATSSTEMSRRLEVQMKVNAADTNASGGDFCLSRVAGEEVAGASPSASVSTVSICSESSGELDEGSAWTWLSRRSSAFLVAR